MAIHPKRRVFLSDPLKQNARENGDRKEKRYEQRVLFFIFIHLSQHDHPDPGSRRKPGDHRAETDYALHI